MMNTTRIYRFHQYGNSEFIMPDAKDTKAA
jgi:hypothetical protein